MVTVAKEPQKLTKKDYQSNQEVRWCPGCGDYAILAAVQRVMPKLGIPREKTVFISGIGCSSRFPYYMNTYGFHTIHGRAPAVATGVKVANPDLSVWVVTGDGDSLSIGGNHLIHALRRNVDLKILLFNNRIYGLTKGQYSPTSQLGTKTKSTPFGSIDQPFNPVALALGAGATFVARSIDTDAKHLEPILQQAAAHEGAALVEIIQNCPVFNDKAFVHFTGKEVKNDRQLRLVDGQPLRFGPNDGKGLRLAGMEPEVVDVGPNGVPESELIVHDESAQSPALASLLASLEYPDFPVPIGVFRNTPRAVYERAVHEQIAQARAKKGPGDLEKLLKSGDTWTV